MSSQALWIKSKAKDSLNPAQVETTLNALAAAWNGPLSEFLRDFPLGEEALIHLLAVSQICAERLQRVPELLRWLARPEISMSDRGPRRIKGIRADRGQLVALVATSCCSEGIGFIARRRRRT